MGYGVKRFTELRAWQACVAYKRAVYQLCAREPIVSDWKRRGQLEDSVWGPPAHVAEGFGRFNPLDFARFVVMARASLIESQNHLLDFVDRGYITDEQREALNQLAEVALREVTGLVEYLQSPEAARHARTARERGIAKRAARKTARTMNEALRTQNPEQGTANTERRTEPEPEHEPGSGNQED